MIVIIGILAVALIPRLTGAQATARDTARKASLQQAATVISSYLSQENSPAALTTAPSTGGQFTLSGQANAVSGYGTLPIADPQGNSYWITGSNTAGYVLCTNLEKSGQGNLDKVSCANATASDTAGTATGKTYIVKINI